jgi:tetratricopeptide (TPR) repeat protein
LLVAVSFAPAAAAHFVWDDDLHVTGNPLLRSAHGLYRLWFDPAAFQQYYPLTQTTWWLEYHLWGDAPVGYHLNNLLIHAANALLLWRLLRRLGVPGAWWAAALFAVHPMQVETVAWVMERKNLLSGFFYLTAFHCFLGPLRLSPPRPAARPASWREGARAYAAGVSCFLAALLAKSVAATLPAAALLLCWWKRGRIARREWLQMLPLLPLSAASGLWTGYLERTRVGAAGPDWAFSPLDRFLIAGRALWHYVTKLVWPSPLMLFYPRWHVDAAAWPQYLFPLAFLGLLLALWAARTRTGRGPLTAVLFFAGTLFPALGFVNVYPMRYSYVADHFQYTACIGLVALAAALLARLKAVRPAWGPVARAGLALWVIILSALAFRHSLVFHDGLTLYTDLVRKNPASWAGHHLLAAELLGRGRVPEAVAQFAAATQAHPPEPTNWEGLGNALVTAGQVDRGRAILEDVLRQHPGSAKACNDLARAYILSGRADDAIRLYRRAVSLDPAFALAHYNLGDMLAQAGQFPAAEAEFRAALDAWSTDRATGGRGEYLPDAAFKLGLSLAEQGRVADALPFFEQATALRPGWRQAEQVLNQARQVVRQARPASRQSPAGLAP